MKHLLNICLLIICLGTFSCKKYEDGPSFSLYTKKARLANKWKIDTYYLNGVDRTYDYRTIFTSETLQIFKSGKFLSTESSTWSWAALTYGGTWDFTDKKEDLEMYPQSPGSGYKLFKILRLETDQLWLRRVINPDSTVEYHYITQTNPN